MTESEYIHKSINLHYAHIAHDDTTEGTEQSH